MLESSCLVIEKLFFTIQSSLGVIYRQLFVQSYMSPCFSLVSVLFPKPRPNIHPPKLLRIQHQIKPFNISCGTPQSCIQVRHSEKITQHEQDNRREKIPKHTNLISFSIFASALGISLLSAMLFFSLISPKSKVLRKPCSLFGLPSFKACVLAHTHCRINMPHWEYKSHIHISRLCYCSRLLAHPKPSQVIHCFKERNVCHT
jgi:hypothetical protein